jgi:polyisoprenoid-binding protein YceI
MKKLVTILGLVSLLSFSFGETLQYDSASKSLVNFTIKQMNVPVTGEFRQPKIDFILNKDDLVKSKAEVYLSLKFISAPTTEINDTSQTKEWFDIEKFPIANFKSNKINKVGNDYEAVGILNIKGKTKEIKIPFKIDNNLVSGEFSFNRNDFNIGDGMWADTSYIANEVKMNFHFKVKN